MDLCSNDDSYGLNLAHIWPSAVKPHAHNKHAQYRQFKRTTESRQREVATGSEACDTQMNRAGRLCYARTLQRSTVEPLRGAAAAAAEALGALERIPRLQVVPPRLCGRSRRRLSQHAEVQVLRMKSPSTSRPEGSTQSSGAGCVHLSYAPSHCPREPRALARLLSTYGSGRAPLSAAICEAEQRRMVTVPGRVDARSSRWSCLDARTLRGGYSQRHIRAKAASRQGLAR